MFEIYERNRLGAPRPLSREANTYVASPSELDPLEQPLGWAVDQLMVCFHFYGLHTFHEHVFTFHSHCRVVPQSKMESIEQYTLLISAKMQNSANVDEFKEILKQTDHCLHLLSLLEDVEIVSARLGFEKEDIIGCLQGAYLDDNANPVLVDTTVADGDMELDELD